MSTKKYKKFGSNYNNPQVRVVPDIYGFPHYSFGGWLKENKKGILGGLKTIGGAALLATGVGGAAGIGLMSSGVSNIAGEISQDAQANEMNDQIKAQQLEQIQMNQRNANANLDNTMNPTFPMGGMIPYSNAELEKEEVVQTPTGQVETVDGPSHKQGGVNIQAPVGSRVFSDRLKPKGSKETYAELADRIKKQIDKYNKILNS